MVFFLNQKGVAKGGMPSCEKERLCLCRAERWSYTGTAWLRKGRCDGGLLVDQEKVCAEMKKHFWTSVLEMYAAERHIHK